MSPRISLARSAAIAILAMAPAALASQPPQHGAAAANWVWAADCPCAMVAVAHGDDEPPAALPEGVAQSLRAEGLYVPAALIEGQAPGDEVVLDRDAAARLSGDCEALAQAIFGLLPPEAWRVERSTRGADPAAPAPPGRAGTLYHTALRPIAYELAQPGVEPVRLHGTLARGNGGLAILLRVEGDAPVQDLDRIALARGPSWPAGTDGTPSRRGPVTVGGGQAWLAPVTMASPSGMLAQGLWPAGWAGLTSCWSNGHIVLLTVLVREPGSGPARVWPSAPGPDFVERALRSGAAPLFGLSASETLDYWTRYARHARFGSVCGAKAPVADGTQAPPQGANGRSNEWGWQTDLVLERLARLPAHAHAVGPDQLSWLLAPSAPASVAPYLPGLAPSSERPGDGMASGSLLCEGDGWPASVLRTMPQGVVWALTDTRLTLTFASETGAAYQRSWAADEPQYSIRDLAEVLPFLLGEYGRRLTLVPVDVRQVEGTDWWCVTPDPDHEVGLLERVRVGDTPWGRCRIYVDPAILHIVFDLPEEEGGAE